MGIERKTIFHCDNKLYHPYKSGVSEDGVDWICARIDSGKLEAVSIKVRKVSDLSGGDLDREGLHFFHDFDCLKDWIREKLSPPPPEELTPEPQAVVPQVKENIEDDIPY